MLLKKKYLSFKPKRVKVSLGLLLCLVSFFLLISCKKVKLSDVPKPSPVYISSNYYILELNGDSPQYCDFKRLSEKDKIEYVKIYGALPPSFTGLDHSLAIEYSNYKDIVVTKGYKFTFLYEDDKKFIVEIKRVRGKDYHGGS